MELDKVILVVVCSAEVATVSVAVIGSEQER